MSLAVAYTRTTNNSHTDSLKNKKKNQCASQDKNLMMANLEYFYFSMDSLHELCMINMGGITIIARLDEQAATNSFAYRIRFCLKYKNKIQ